MIARTATRPNLSRATVADRAIEVADAEGLAAVTIRRLASDLGVTPMALYWHFKTKDELLAGAAERILESATPVPANVSEWSSVLRHLMQDLVRLLQPHPQFAELVAGRFFHTENGLTMTERALNCLSDAGFSPRETAQLAGLALRTVLSLVTADLVAGIGTDPERREEYLQNKQNVLAGVSAQRFPTLVARAEEMTYCIDPDTYFDFGIEHFLAGAEQLAARK